MGGCGGEKGEEMVNGEGSLVVVVVVVWETYGVGSNMYSGVWLCG